MTTKVLIDTDTGVDDAVGVVLGLLDPRLDVVGITTVFGNVDVDKTTRNTLTLAEILNRGDVPVARGAHKGLLGRPSFVPFIHGEDGVGNANLPDPTLEPVAEHAAELIIRLAREHSGELVLVPVGPLTNLALALALDPELTRHVRGVVWMGGVMATPGNVTPVAEADTWHDPEAAQVVFEADWPITMVGLDVTDRALLDEDDLERMVASGTPAGEYLGRIVPFYIDFYATKLGRRACAVHSALAVAVAADPTLVTASVRAPVAVELAGRYTRAMTVVDRRDLRQGATLDSSRHDVEIATEVDLARFKASLMERVCALQPLVRP